MSRVRYMQNTWQALGASGDHPLVAKEGAPWEVRLRGSATPVTFYTSDVGGAGFAGTVANLAVRDGRVEPLSSSGGALWLDSGVSYDEYTTADGKAVSGGNPLVKRGAGEATSAAALQAVETRVVPDTDVVNASRVGAEGRTVYRVPKADAAEYDLRDFYLGTSQPADLEPYVHDMLNKTAAGGGSGLIPDSEEPWEVASTITPPFNSRMHGPAPVGLANRFSTNGHGTTVTKLPASPNKIGEAWLKLKSGANGPLIRSDYDNSAGKRGPAYGNGGFAQWFTALNIAFDHNGHNQTGALRAIDIRDAWYMNFYFCRLVEPRGIGWGIDNCNECNGTRVTTAGQVEHTTTGTGDITNGSPTLLNASGSWAIGDLIWTSPAAGIAQGTWVTNVVGSTVTLSANATATTVGISLLKTTPIATTLLALQNTTTDCIWSDISMHGGGTSVLLDGCYGTSVSGLAGYSIGSYNLWIRDTGGVSCWDNRVNLRLDKASKHNCRIDQLPFMNIVDVAGMEPGIFGNPVDADGGWCTLFDDGQKNMGRVVGKRYTGGGFGPTMLGAYRAGPNSAGSQFVWAEDLT